MNFIESDDHAVWEALAEEIDRQQDGLEMIASENYTSPAIMQAVGSVLTNKYAEGYPGKRYYGGCEHVDVIENLARDRAKQLFGAEHANVQPHSGSQANMAVYMTAIQPGDTVLGLELGTWRAFDARNEAEHFRAFSTTSSAMASRATRIESTSIKWPPWPASISRS